MASSEKLNTEFILIAGSFGMLLLTVAVILFIYLYQRKLIKRKMAYQKIENTLKRKELQTTYALIEGQDTERQRIARELHDSLGSILVTLTMYTDSLIKTETATEKQRSLIEKISSIGKQAYQETRRISHELDASMHKHFGLQSALEDLLGVINGINEIEVKTSFDLHHEPSVDISFNLYRITQ